MNIIAVARQLDTAIANKIKPKNLEEIQAEVLLARGRISDQHAGCSPQRMPPEAKDFRNACVTRPGACDRSAGDDYRRQPSPALSGATDLRRL